MVDQPLGCPVEQRRRRVNVDWGSLNQGLVPFLRVFLGGVAEEPRTDGPPNEVVITTGREDIVFVPEQRERLIRSGSALCLPVHDT